MNKIDSTFCLEDQISVEALRLANIAGEPIDLTLQRAKAYRKFLKRKVGKS